jgi:uncharacterized protein (TIGR00255 family)
MVNSMTGFAARRGRGAGASWLWEMRGVNGRGLDLRLRLPDGVEGLEPAVRAAVGAALSRGNVTLSLRLERDAAAAPGALNEAALAAALTALGGVAAGARAQGVDLRPASAAEVLRLPGVWGSEGGADTEELRDALLNDLPALLQEFNATRAAEGRELAAILTRQIDRIEALTTEAEALLPARTAAAAQTLHANLARVLENTDGADPDRVAQELALIAVKADVTEEIDRLRAHVSAARGHLASGGSVGRKLDFLMQEFNREANTLCSKAQYAALTAIGLDLKVAIDQMREQVANVE